MSRAVTICLLICSFSVVNGQWSSTPRPGTRQCAWGMGYPPACPRPEDPPTLTKCCRHLREPSCCSERSNTVCGVLNLGTRSQTGTFSHDPGPAWETLWCPSQGRADNEVHCCFSKIILFPYFRMRCCSAAVKWGVIGGVIGGILVIGLIFFIALRCRAARARQNSGAARSAVIASSLSLARPSVVATPSNVPVSTGVDSYQTPKDPAAPPDYHAATSYPLPPGPHPSPGGAMAGPYPPPSGAMAGPYPPPSGAMAGPYPPPTTGYGSMAPQGDSSTPPPYPGPPISGPIYHRPQPGTGGGGEKTEQ